MNIYKVIAYKNVSFDHLEFFWSHNLRWLESFKGLQCQKILRILKFNARRKRSKNFYNSHIECLEPDGKSQNINTSQNPSRLSAFTPVVIWFDENGTVANLAKFQMMFLRKNVDTEFYSNINGKIVLRKNK